MMKSFVMILCGVLTISATAQNFDSSGNGLLKNAYFVRQVLLSNFDPNTSAVGRARSIIGTMTFDGSGNYSFTGQMMDTQIGSAQAYSTSGVYLASPSGFVQIQNPIDSTDTEYGGFGAIGPSAIVASATEGNYDDIFVAIPAGSGVSNGSVQGAYRVGFMDFLQGNASQVRDGYYTLNSSGNGSLGNVTVSGAMANQGNNNTTQSLSGVTYSIANSNGSGTITFPTSSTPLTALVSGQKTFYISADGNILLAGSPGGFDLVVGIKSVSGATNSLYQGTYYNAALENDASDVSNGNNGIDSFYGSTLALGEGDSIFHERLVYFNSPVEDYTADGPYSIGSDGTSNDGFFETLLGANGQAIVQVGGGSFYSLIVGFQAKQSSGTGVFIDPLRIWNAGSFAPVTNSVAPGEYVSIFGTGLSSATLAAQSFPLQTTLGGVRVTVNGRPAALSYVSPTQINLLIPYATAESYATFQVTNNGVASNQVTVYTNLTAPGVFAQSNGFGPAAVLHGDFSLVTKSNPAKAGETLQLYVTGLGSVSPPVADGAAAPSSPLSTVTANVGVDIQDQNGDPVFPCTVTFTGLAPGFAGLYQINFTVPSGVPSGLSWVNVGTPDAYTSEAKLYMQ